MPPTLPNLSHLFDPGSLGIVVFGTVLATVARCGWGDFGAAIKAASGLMRRRFQIEANRKALAKAISAIQRDGFHRADPALPPDRALSLMVETYLRHGAPEALGQIRKAERALDEARRVSASQVFIWSGELAPVFGLIGTLYGLAQLTPATGADVTTMIMSGVSTAVLTSLYGALLAHLVCYPLASAIERRGLIEEQNREMLAAWFVAQIDLADVAATARRAHLRGVT